LGWSGFAKLGRDPRAENTKLREKLFDMLNRKIVGGLAIEQSAVCKRSAGYASRHQSPNEGRAGIG